jgi:hypothetical protein
VKSLTVRNTFAGALQASSPEINKHSMPSLQIYRFVGGIVVFDALVFEFIGLAMLVLCLAVLAFPSRRPPVRHARDH